LWMFQRVNYGEVTNPKNRALPDLTPREWAMMIPTVGLAIVMGVFPNIFLKPMEPSIVRTIDRINGTVTSSRADDRRPTTEVRRPTTEVRRPMSDVEQRPAGLRTSDFGPRTAKGGAR